MAQYPWLTKPPGRKWTVRAPVPKDLVSIMGRKEIWETLDTHDRSIAVARYHDVAKAIQDQFNAHREPAADAAAPLITRLTAQELATLATRRFQDTINADFNWRAEMWAAVTSDPEAFATWRLLPLLSNEITSRRIQDMDIHEQFLLRLNNHRKFKHRELTNALVVGDGTSQDEAIKNLLGKRGLSNDDLSSLRRRLLQAEINAISAIIEGKVDAHDIHAPMPATPWQPEKPLNTTGWEALISKWEKAHSRMRKPEPTRKEWRAKVEKFAARVGKLPGAVTQEDVQEWRDYRLDAGIAPATVAYGDLSVLRTIFGLGVQEGLLDYNPAETVRVIGFDGKKPKSEQMGGFDDKEARVILQAARKETLAFRRWVPWLCATTGSRLSPMMNLRPQDITKVEGIWCVSILKAAGPIKTNESERTIPLHPILLKQGFLAFVKTRKAQPRLFYDEHRKRAGARQHNPGKTKCGHLRNWIHMIATKHNLAIGRENLKDPNHAWRHRLKTIGRAAGVEEHTLDQITGHAPITEGGAYGTTTIPTLLTAVTKLKFPD